MGHDLLPTHLKDFHTHSVIGSQEQVFSAEGRTHALPHFTEEKDEKDTPGIDCMPGGHTTYTGDPSGVVQLQFLAQYTSFIPVFCILLVSKSYE